MAGNNRFLFYTVLVANHLPGQLYIVDLDTLRRWKFSDLLSGPIYEISVSRDGEFIAVADRKPECRVFRTRDLIATEPVR